MPKQRAVRVLVIEDNATTRVLVQQQIRALGGEATGVGTIAEAVAALSSGEYDRVLLDCHLDDALPEHFAALAPYADRIVAITATIDSEARSICEALGVATIMKKPLGNQSLRELLGYSEPPPVSVSASGEALLRELAMLTDARGVSEIVEGFVANSISRLEALREAVRQADCERLRVVSHTWKGVAGSFGAEGLARLLDQVETAATAGDQLTGARLLPEIEEEFGRVGDRLTRLTVELHPRGSTGE